MELYLAYKAVDVYGFDRYRGFDPELDSYLALSWCIKAYRPIYGL